MTTTSVESLLDDLRPAPPAAPAGGRADGAGFDLVITPARGWQGLELGKLWRYRELLLHLAGRDVKVRYKQTMLGALWAIIQPLTGMVVLSAFFGSIIPRGWLDAVPYKIFLYAGLLPWTFFAAAVTAATNSLVSNAQIMGKVYFPRLILPISSLGAPLVDYAVASVVLLGLMVYYRVAPTPELLLLPLLVLATVVAAMGVGVGLASLTACYRDFRYVVNFLVQVWFFVTPVIYPVAILGPRWRWLLRLNPMGGTIEAFRACVLGTPIDYVDLAISTAVSCLLLAAAVLVFRRAERRMVDVI